MSPATSGSPTAELWELFAQAQPLSGAERAALIAGLRSERPALAAELESMLAASGDDAALAIESRLPGSAAEGDASGMTAGPYRLIRRIGGGGMGDVYLAERADEQFEQRVAVKLMRPGIASAEMLERFRLERDVLARLSHPAVVPLLDGGTAEDGRPYLALQYVEGLPITDYCAAAGLSPRRRLRLFAGLCRAVQYAHTNLVVHRDLKPSNVLVTDEGEVRLLDFGVAKLLGGGVGREITETVKAPMTSGRAAPEQWAGGGSTTATDVWALGVLLHELLTGRLPQQGEDGGGRSDRRGIDPGLGRDLVAILGKALADEPADRYSSAGHLADDVERHLSNLPVLARPDSWLYRSGRFIRRYRTASTLIAASVLFLVVLTTVASIQALRIREQRNRAEAEERQATAVVDLLVELFGGADPLRGAERDAILVADLIDRGEVHADRLADQPEVQARLRAVLGKILVERGDRQRGHDLLATALEAQRAQLGRDDPRVVDTTFDLARALHLRGELDATRALLRETVAGLEEQDPPPEPELLALGYQMLGGVVPGEEGEGLIRRAIAIRREQPTADPVNQGVALVVLATHHQVRGEAAEACRLFGEAASVLRPELGDEHSQFLGVRSNLASCSDDPAFAAREHEEILRLRVRRLGDDHVVVGNSWIGLGEAKQALGDHPEAVRAFSEGWRIWHAASPTMPRTVQAARGWAATLEALDRSEEAREVLDATLDGYRAAGKEVPRSLREASERNLRRLAGEELSPS